ncbi:protein-(glutamine-N5) methyltransferase, release factor-specific [Syntrophotalea acetylenivorans]|uniref:Release factor glutamine methyltransferase n=1 Tax=Syntrophotalea acetylenivorans TaxID=1842532 RepID=A0A1L3GQ78_9BACT|nr:protein-(glutamine-N5) methyltransferase, release factor-specific [Syntrophotalea acetylenivorans]
MAEPWTVLKVLQWTAGYLQEQGIEGARLDAELLLTEVLQLDRVGLYVNYDRPLEATELAAYRQLVGRRARREPVAYILGRSEFWSLPLVVRPEVLIPRPDTEVLVEEALQRADSESRILDVGTGSGAIAIALAHELPGAQLVAIDLSDAALAVAKENARSNNVAERISFQQGDLQSLPTGPFELIVANPPYIPQGDLASLQPDVRDYEPHLALAGGSDGLDCYRILSAQSRQCLTAGGWMLLEVGVGQAQAVQQLLTQAGLVEVFCRNDYAGVARVVGGRCAVTAKA